MVGGRFITGVYPSVYKQDISKNDAGMIIKHDIKRFHDESWKPIYFGVKSIKVKVSYKNSACVVLCTLVSAGFF